MNMDFRRADLRKARRCPTCGATYESLLGDRCSADGAPLVAPKLINQLLINRQFRVIEPIGEGAFARVFAAADCKAPPDAPLVALKVLKPAMIRHQEALARFDREADLLGQLVGVPGVVQYIGQGKAEQGSPYLALEYLNGQTLQEVLRGYRRLPPLVACRVTLKLLRAIDAVHRMGIIHRDLKPSNIIMISADDEIELRLLDFGVAQSPNRSDRDLTITMQHRTVGTPYYMSPELWDDSRVDQRSDLYAIGVILYFMLVGEKPYTGELLQVSNQHKIAPVPEIPVAGDITEIMPYVVTRAMAKRADDRFSSAREMYDVLAAGLGMPSFEAVSLGTSSDTVLIETDPWTSSTPSKGVTIVGSDAFTGRPRSLLTPRRLTRAASAAFVAFALSLSLTPFLQSSPEAPDVSVVSPVGHPPTPRMAPARPIRRAQPEPVFVTHVIDRAELLNWPVAPEFKIKRPPCDWSSKCTVHDPITKACLKRERVKVCK